MVTSSLSALNAYLEGEARYRQADYPGAIDAFERAVAADSTFALAWSKLANAWSWVPRPDPRVVIDAQARALGNTARLPARETTLLRVLADLNLSVAPRVDSRVCPALSR